MTRKKKTPTETKVPKIYIEHKNDHQKEFLEVICKKDIVLGCGPAGSGKTFLSVAMALKAYYEGIVSKILITRPVIEAGERLGFLPGSADEKLMPYLMPIYDQLEKFINLTEIAFLRKSNVLRVEPLAYLRGRSIENSILLVDEAQNCTWDQMKMVLTRIGQGSKFILNGDPEQSDLPWDKRGAFYWACDNLNKIPEIGVVKFDHSDIIRHDVIEKILRKFEEKDEKAQERTGPK